MAILKDLIVHGSSRFLNKIYASELETPLISADAGVFKKLTAKDLTAETATVIGLLDVQGQLHTNTWTNSNIATIDGCFYITPTLSSDTGSIVFTSTNVASLTGNFTGVDSLYIGGSSSGSTVQWTSNSKVLLTGEVEINGQWLPLGTLLGTLSANATTSSIGLKELKDNRHNDSSIIIDIRNIVGSTSVEYRNLKISLYQRKDGNDSKPLGIYMTAMGANGKTFIDIYGGVNATTTAGSSGGFADPNLRIGNLSGLGAVEGTTPTGWGIYTTNGYFKGVIVSSAGKIGNFTINSALYSNNHSAWNSNVSGIYINNDGISGGAGGKWWLWNDGSAKIGAMTLSAAGVLIVPAANVSGELTAATINGSKITANTITADQIATGAIKTDELDANAVTSAKIKAGEVKATNIASNAVTADKLDATTINASNKLTVGALTTTDQDNILNSNIQIGGTNLLKDTDATNIAKTITIASTSSSAYSEGWTATVTRIEGENTYTVSFDAKASEDTGVNCYWYYPNTTTSSLSSTGQTSLSGDGSCGVTLTTEWKRYWVTWTQSDTAATDKRLIVCRLSKPSSGTKTVEVRAIKFEVGNKATDWSPAPEDLDVHKYITDITNDGIFIHPNANNTDGIQIQDTISIIRDGDVVADYGENIILGNKGNAQSPNENLLYLSKSSISLRGGNYNAVAKNRVFEVSESMNSIVIETSSNTKQYTNSKIGNIKTISEVAINHTPLAENEYTINKQQNKITLVNYPNNGVLIITYIPNYLDEVITFSTDSESEYERKTFLMPDNTSLILSILLNNTQLVENTDYTYDSSKLLIHLTSDPSTGKTLTVNYRRESRYFYTLGRRNMEQIGDYSVVIGENCTGAGYASFSGGQNTYVSGKNSFGFGYGEDNLNCIKVTGQNSGAIGSALNVSGHGSFVCGRYNVDNYNLRFAVGNGTGVGARNNIFAAGNKNIYINGSLYSGMVGTSNTPRKMFTTGTAVSDNISISANNVSGAKTVSVAKTGYTPIGVVGYEIGNASTSGTNASPCFPYIMRINDNNISFNIRNTSSSASKIKITFYVYYIATAAL